MHTGVELLDSQIDLILLLLNWKQWIHRGKCVIYVLNILYLRYFTSITGIAS